LPLIAVDPYGNQRNLFPYFNLSNGTVSGSRLTVHQVSIHQSLVEDVDGVSLRVDVWFTCSYEKDGTAIKIGGKFEEANLGETYLPML
jgi:hypothetical protein